MEIATVPRRGRPLPTRWRVVAVLAIVLPVTVFALVPTGLGLQRYVITGTSMAGSIDRGSLVFERTAPAGDLREGDVITFEPPSGFAARGLVTHRILSIEAGGLQTKGDANHFRDPWTLPAGEPQTRVVLAVPYVGYPFTRDVDRGMWLLMALGPLALILVVALLRDSSRVSRRRERGGLASVARSQTR